MIRIKWAAQEYDTINDNTPLICTCCQSLAFIQTIIGLHFHFIFNVSYQICMFNILVLQFPWIIFYLTCKMINFLRCEIISEFWLDLRFQPKNKKKCIS